MRLIANPETGRLRIETDHAATWRWHMRGFPKPTLRQSGAHLFGEGYGG